MRIHRHGVRRKSHNESKKERKEFKKILDSLNGKRRIRTPNDETLKQ